MNDWQPITIEAGDDTLEAKRYERTISIEISRDPRGDEYGRYGSIDLSLEDAEALGRWLIGTKKPASD